ncbi:hypothetical protein [Micromonospora deserti]|nr:hypothetical protein [Micromonospora deserti]
MGRCVQHDASSLLILDLTGSGLGVAGMVAAEIAPVLLLAPPGRR